MDTAEILQELAARTLRYGGAWGLNHSKRLIAIAIRIAAGREHDTDALRMAAYLHDWGAYETWSMAGVDHATRSAELIPAVLAELGVTGDTPGKVAICARHHHDCDATASLEAILLHDADAIDFLGVTGVLRTFSRQPRDLRGAYQKTRERLSALRERLVLDSSRAIAEPLHARAERVLQDLELETGGCF